MQFESAAPIFRAKAATQRAPFPQRSASVPSGLKNRILKSIFEDFWTKINPSLPIPVCLSQSDAINL
jgi:hypothetical protein